MPSLSLASTWVYFITSHVNVNSCFITSRDLSIIVVNGTTVL